MDLLSLTIIAVGLAMDCFSVSIASGMAMNQSKTANALRIASLFGFFQGFMLLAGWLSILSFSSFISEIDHWIAFGLLAFIGGQMICDSLKGEVSGVKALGLSNLLLLSVATSIDSLGVGVSFAILGSSVTVPAIVIGSVSFLFSIVGVLFGERLGRAVEERIGIIGGAILICIGIKILLEHLVFT
jgi:putative Mn2+ efflux pump MntP